MVLVPYQNKSATGTEKIKEDKIALSFQNSQTNWLLSWYQATVCAAVKNKKPIIRTWVNSWGTIWRYFDGRNFYKNKTQFR